MVVLPMVVVGVSLWCQYDKTTSTYSFLIAVSFGCVPCSLAGDLFFIVENALNLQALSNRGCLVLTA